MVSASLRRTHFMGGSSRPHRKYEEPDIRLFPDEGVTPLGAGTGESVAGQASRSPEDGSAHAAHLGDLDVLTLPSIVLT